MSYQGRFRPSNTKKYRGNPTNIIYRSLWERKFMVYCDKTENILEWGSEEISIPYKSPIDYFPDFYIKYKDSQGKVKRSLIEIKPFKQTQQPPLQEKKTKSYVYEVTQYVTNQAKWAAAEEFCKDRLWEFKVFTEKELGIK
jgi:hypothetical protein